MLISTRTRSLRLPRVARTLPQPRARRLPTRAARHVVVWLLVVVAIGLLDIAAVGVLAPNVRGLTAESVGQLQGLAGSVPSLLLGAALVLVVAGLVAGGPRLLPRR